MLNTDYGTTMIMAHRGYSAAAPENTITAFQKCIDNRFTAAELDVQMLADGTIVVLHDDNLKRTAGIPSPAPVRLECISLKIADCFLNYICCIHAICPDDILMRKLTMDIQMRVFCKQVLEVVIVVNA